MSSARDYLRPNEAVFVGYINTVVGAVTREGGDPKAVIGEAVPWANMPYSLTPVPQDGMNRANRAFYLPKGQALWAARESTSNVTDGPIIGCQGGWY